MSGRRYGAPGIRRQHRSGGSVFAWPAPNTTLVYRYQDSVVTSSPDIDSIPPFIGSPTVSQAVASQKPHLETDDALFVKAANQFLNNVAAGTIFAAGAFPTLLLVARFNSLTLGQYPLSLYGVGNVNFQSNSMHYTAPGFGVIWDTPEGTVSADVAFSDTTNMHVFRSTLRSDGAYTSIDGATPTSAALANTGLNVAQTQVAVGNSLSLATADIDFKLGAFGVWNDAEIAYIERELLKLV